MSQDQRPTPARTPTRRDVLLSGGALLGMGMLSPLSLASVQAGARGNAKAKAVIHIFMGGGLSHIDSFDPKPLAPIEVRGELGVVKSKLVGEPLAGGMTRTAAIADKIAIVRSMTHTEAAHERGTHNLLTGYKPSPAIQYPSMGSVVSQQLGVREDLPPYVVIPRVSGLAAPYLGSGYLSSAFGPFSVRGEPSSKDFKVKDLDPSKDVDAERLARRRELVKMVGAGMRDEGRVDSVEATDSFYGQAYRLIGSDSAREAFRIDGETAKVRDRYGRTAMGQRLCLARRLVTAGVRYVTVLDDGYDMHRNIFPAMRTKMGQFDQAFGTLIAELDERGLLDETLVLVTSEFGRTPRVNADRGRDHWPRVFSVVLAGGGIKRGVIHGASDPDGREPLESPVSPADLAATVFTLAGIDPTERLMSPGDRPIDIVRDGRVIREILA